MISISLTEKMVGEERRGKQLNRPQKPLTFSLLKVFGYQKPFFLELKSLQLFFAIKKAS